MEEVFTTVNNDYYNANGELLRGPFRNYVSDVNEIEGPIVIKGDLYVDGRVCFRHDYGSIDDTERLETRITILNKKIDDLLGGNQVVQYNLLNTIENQSCKTMMENIELRDKLFEMEKMLFYICKRFNVEFAELSNNINGELESLGNRRNFDKRMDVISTI